MTANPRHPTGAGASAPWRYVVVGERVRVGRRAGRGDHRRRRGPSGAAGWGRRGDRSSGSRAQGRQEPTHLDLRVSRGSDVSRAERRADIERVVAEVRARGGQLLRIGEHQLADRVFALVADPEGNEFYLVDTPAQCSGTSPAGAPSPPATTAASRVARSHSPPEAYWRMAVIGGCSSFETRRAVRSSSRRRSVDGASRAARPVRPAERPPRAVAPARSAGRPLSAAAAREMRRPRP